jgi:hypothetical protein
MTFTYYFVTLLGVFEGQREVMYYDCLYVGDYYTLLVDA